ncbi:hypothetical protein UAY_03087 [Enterococcus moraviensis ATCC BAA-383]|uniref:DUF3958 domain-containing protein n=1 Tax=Enterococcus moraviensis ATCC BAA-383 TaxID=1158609 RepID=R2QHW2_9ENTE|nr:DUF3958 family protein [Enterococcus moraviensis]EOH96177.1 hypothetical protein UAY_03087 [Enterococcus moraviensis ATCC BAA-383]EOT66149.1 hypothetical protein I586_02420 [Enterococcus moraviensis ATCC BAA-383]OJG64435.1 hypothetical protein RV09_GL001864 [Enterococcus moraviensis]
MTEIELEMTTRNVRQLEENQQENENQQRGMEQAMELYHEHFQRSNDLYSGINDTFYRNDFAPVFQQMQDEIHHERRQLFDQLEDELEELKQENRALDDQLSEEQYKRQQLLNKADEEEINNEQY